MKKHIWKNKEQLYFLYTKSCNFLKELQLLYFLQRTKQILFKKYFLLCFLTNKLKTEENFPEHASYKILRTNKTIKAILFFAFLITTIEFLLISFTTIYPLISKTIFYFFIGSALPLLSFFNLLERKFGYNLPEIYIFIFSFLL